MGEVSAIFHNWKDAAGLKCVMWLCIDCMDTFWKQADINKRARNSKYNNS